MQVTYALAIARAGKFVDLLCNPSCLQDVCPMNLVYWP